MDERWSGRHVTVTLEFDNWAEAGTTDDDVRESVVHAIRNGVGLVSNIDLQPIEIVGG